MKSKLLVFFVCFSSLFLMGCVSKTEEAKISKENSNNTNSTVLAPVIPPTMQALPVPDMEKLAKEYEAIPLSMFKDGFSHARFHNKDNKPEYEVYNEKQIAGIAENMISWQCKDGGWSKNIDFARIQTAEQWASPRFQGGFRQGSTLDNGNVYTQIQYLALVYKQIPDQRYVDSMTKALNWIFNAQNPKSGGFRGADVDAITFNDEVMSGVLKLFRSIADDDDLYGFFPKELRQKANEAYDKTLQCILDCQIKVPMPDGSVLLTAWGQQHSHETLEPVWARNYEPPAITASESCGVIRCLMAIENPSDAVKNAIISACEWLNRDDIKIWGYELVRKPIDDVVLGGRHYNFDQLLVEKKDAEPLWARFYDPVTMKPLWYDRGKKLCNEYNEISMERRNGYRFVYNWPKKLLEVDLPAWKAKNGIK